jgi:glyoxylase-like metal-dependent hydrolase (beta-lactamase superfamily II)
MIFRHFLLRVPMAIGEVNAHIFGCSDTHEAVLIDAGIYDAGVEQFIKSNELNLSTVFLTHEHPDHVDGARDYAERFGAKIVAGLASLGACKADRVLSHGDELNVGAITGRIVSTPGHTAVALTLIFPGMVFSGDALFAGSVGGTSSPEAYAQQIAAIREHLFSLPDDYEVHSGHGPATTIGIEERFNPFFVSEP